MSGPGLNQSTATQTTDYLETSGIVVAVSADWARVQVEPMAGGCGGCGSRGTCSTATVFGLFRRSGNLIAARNPIAARPGDSVVLGIPARAIQTLSLLFYLMPLLSFIAGAVLADRVLIPLWPAAGELPVLLAGLVGMWLGLKAAARAGISLGRRQGFRPELRRVTGGIGKITTLEVHKGENAGS